MERFVFSKVPAWVLIVTVILAILGMMGFGVLTYDHVKGKGRFGALSIAAGFISSFPEQAWATLRKGDPLMSARQGRFEGEAGWDVAPGTALDGYLLLSRHDGEADRHVVELVDLANFETVYQWFPDADMLFDGVSTEGVDSYTRALRTRPFFRAVHPMPTEDGGLIIKDHGSPLFRIDACGGLVWRQEDIIFHHSTAAAGDGTYWISAHAPASDLPIQAGGEYVDDSLAHVTAEGEILQNISLTEVMLDEDLAPYFLTDIFGATVNDRIHLNDIQPVLNDGPYWKKGDLFLSMRHMSTVALFRPSTGEIVWTKRGPWLAQHDVDIIDDHRISVFSNNTYQAGKGAYILGANEVFVYDFETDTTTSPYRDVMEALDVRTVSEGLAEWLPGGGVLIEEENSGRILILAADGTLLATFVNRAGEDGGVYRLGWSRYLGRAAGDRLLEAVRAAPCSRS